jgi:hypothetical protein
LDLDPPLIGPKSRFEAIFGFWIPVPDPEGVKREKIKGKTKQRTKMFK